MNTIWGATVQRYNSVGHAKECLVGTSGVNTGTRDQMFTHSYTGVPCTTDIHSMVQFPPPEAWHPDQGAHRGLP